MFDSSFEATSRCLRKRFATSLDEQVNVCTVDSVGIESPKFGNEVSLRICDASISFRDDSFESIIKDEHSIVTDFVEIHESPVKEFANWIMKELKNTFVVELDDCTVDSVEVESSRIGKQGSLNICGASISIKDDSFQPVIENENFILTDFEEVHRSPLKTFAVWVSKELTNTFEVELDDCTVVPLGDESVTISGEETPDISDVVPDIKENTAVIGTDTELISTPFYTFYRWIGKMFITNEDSSESDDPKTPQPQFATTNEDPAEPHITKTSQTADIPEQPHSQPQPQPQPQPQLQTNEDPTKSQTTDISKPQQPQLPATKDLNEIPKSETNIIPVKPHPYQYRFDYASEPMTVPICKCSSTENDSSNTLVDIPVDAEISNNSPVMSNKPSNEVVIWLEKIFLVTNGLKTLNYDESLDATPVSKKISLSRLTHKGSRKKEKVFPNLVDFLKNSRKDDKFESFNCKDFQSIRNVLGIDDYQFEHAFDQWYEGQDKISPFVDSVDGLFRLRFIQSAHAYSLHKHAHKYLKHLIKNPESAVQNYLGLYRVGESFCTIEYRDYDPTNFEVACHIYKTHEKNRESGHHRRGHKSIPDRGSSHEAIVYYEGHSLDGVQSEELFKLRRSKTPLQFGLESHQKNILINDLKFFKEINPYFFKLTMAKTKEGPAYFKYTDWLSACPSSSYLKSSKMFRKNFQKELESLFEKIN